jgi:hypothetical protein
LIGISMSTMAYRDEFSGSRVGQQLSLGPKASDLLASFGQTTVRPFRRPGPDVLNATIPVVFIGRNRDGLWVARDAEGKFGGLFWRKEAAIRFARRNAASTGCATVFPQARFELDIQNTVNPLIACAGSARRFLTRQMHKLIYASRRTLQF